MRWTILSLSLAGVMLLGWSGHFTAFGQVGGLPSRTESGSTTPGSRLSPAPGSGRTGPAAGGTFTPLGERPSTLTPPTTPPPVRAPGALGESTLPGEGSAPDAGITPRFGAPPTTDRALDPATLPGRAPSTLDDPAFAPTEPALPDNRFGAPTDPLDAGGALPAERDALPGDDERMLPAPEGARPPAGAPAGAASGGLAKMVYRNQLATFHLVFGLGTAHYRLEHQTGAPVVVQSVPCLDEFGPAGSTSGLVPHVAALRVEESNDPHYWHYRSQDGDEFTAEWAFAKRRSQDGGYAVYRQTRGGWARYGSFSRQVLR